MLFNSLAFLCFFPIVCTIFWVLPSHGKWRNWFLLVASYYFYMNWEPAYALLIGASTLTSWLCALKTEQALRPGAPRKSERIARRWFIAGISVCLGLLFVFKYLNFITTETFQFLSLVGLRLEVPSFPLLLPVGISFFTFQVVGYLIDVRGGEIPAERNLLRYALFVAFFPQLVAGPIENAANMLPQFKRKHRFNSDEFISGITLMLWGYFMKLCIADNVSPYVDAVFSNPEQHTGTTFILATFFYTFQILCDFGGYSLIALGAARAMNFNLTLNFRQPYLATSIKDFWRRWHVSLSGWFTKYVYIPLGGNRCSRRRHCCNLMAVFLLSGLWHGADWTFIAWGGAHGVLMTAHSAMTSFRKHKPTRSSAILKLLAVAGTFVAVALAWVLFRADSLSDAWLIYSKIFTEPGTLYLGQGRKMIALCLLLISVLMLRELHDYRLHNTIGSDAPFSLSRNIAVSAILLTVIIWVGNFNADSFIYFQF